MIIGGGCLDQAAALHNAACCRISGGCEMLIKIFDEENPLSGTLRAALDSWPFSTVAAEGTQPDIIVSSQIHKGDSTEVPHVATQENLKTPVLIIAERVSMVQIRHILTMGAAGILLQETAAQHISWAVPEIVNGCRILSPEIIESVISEYLGSWPMTPQEQSALERVDRLSKREQEILRLLGRGMSNREIARCLVISPETVKDHVRAVRSKLDAPTRVHAAHVAWLTRGATPGNATYQG